MTTGTVPQDVKAYLSAVRARLDDLPADERDDLLADVETSILESAEESDASVESRLGPPDSFADELRAAAGLPPRADSARRTPRPGLRDRITAADAFFSSNSTTRWLRDLAPLWWVLRALVAVGLLDLLYGRSVFEGDAYTLVVGLAAVLAVALSLAIGLRRPRRSAALIVVNAALALAAMPVAWHAIDAGRAAAFEDPVVTAAPEARFGSTVPPGLVYDGQPVENIYAFDRQGRLLGDVRLYDQFSRPLAIGGAGQDSNRRTVRTRDGKLVFNAFPIRYFEPGTKRVAKPGAGAPARPGGLRTRPLAPR
jgi:hypothetical protein